MQSVHTPMAYVCPCLRSMGVRRLAVTSVLSTLTSSISAVMASSSYSGSALNESTYDVLVRKMPMRMCTMALGLA